MDKALFLFSGILMLVAAFITLLSRSKKNDLPLVWALAAIGFCLLTVAMTLNPQQ
jgi:hypothetical protein